MFIPNEKNQACAAMGSQNLNRTAVGDAGDNGELVFMRKFEAEFAHVTNDIEIQESEAMRLALLLLSDIDNATMDKKSSIFVDAIGDDIERRTPVPTADEFKRRADELVTACLKLQSVVRKSKHSFQEAAVYADKRWSTQRPSFLMQKLSEAPWSGPPTNLVVALSDVYEAIRMCEKQADGGAQAKWEAPSTFERVTTKYWVEHDQMEKLLLACVKEAPLLVYGQSNRLTSQNADPNSLDRDMLWESLASEISSVYFDSPRMSMYKRRIAREEGAKLFRVRWYGKKPKGDEPLHLELKTHHEKWVNCSSVKERVTIMEKHMPCFLERIHWNYKEAKCIVVAGNPKLKGASLDDAVNLLVRMHNLVVDEDLRPCVRTAYSRAAFQSPSSNALRLTIDRNITIFDEASAPFGAWCRSDDAFTDPSTFKRLPVSVFEVKLAGSEMPQAITSLLDDGTIVESVKFSKFLTGAGAFNLSKVKTLPYWAEHPNFRSMMTPNEEKGLVKTRSSKDVDPSPPSKMNRQPVPQRQIPRWKLSETTVPSETSREFESSYSSRDHPSSKKRTSFSLFGLCCTRPSKTIAPQKPARVEPKSYFANERTFIQWVSASLWLVTISALLLEREQDGTSHLTFTGIALSTGAVLVAVYATYVYFRRIRLMRSGTPRGYADHAAPLLLAGSVIIGVVVLLVQKTQRVSSAMSQNATLTPEQGFCFLHSNTGISTLQYEPSDVVIDDEHNMLLAPSLERIVGHSTVNPEEGVKVLGRIPGADMEGLVSANGRLFALSEAAEGNASGLLELKWEDGSIELLQRWQIDASVEDIGEGMAYMSSPDGEGSLYIDTGTSIDLYDLPLSSLPPSFLPTGIRPETFRLRKKDSLNKKLLLDGLADGKIASMYGFRGILYVLHDNDGVLRSWNVTRGEMVAEMRLPLVGNVGFEKQWEGIAIETNNGNFAPFAPGDAPNSLRGNTFSTPYSDLIVHLAMDTPPQVWSFAVDEGGLPGQLVFPACAGIS